MRSRLRPVAGAALAATLAAVLQQPLLAQPKSDWELAQEERDWREGEFALPAYPKPADLVPLEVGAATDFRFFVDATSLSVGRDGVVRYTLVARSRSGAENVSFEGIRCKSGRVRAYAFGQGGARWSARGTPWRAIEPGGAQRWHFILWREYFCPHAIAIRDVAEGVDALRRGGHPDAPRADMFSR
ncbi:MAG: hypothetical protein EPO29_00885 [Betaproteobacteria bacterium]|nr:MAG: hypothetical protein EPO29_00885 [Betaproteobacteria bacterium]